MKELLEIESYADNLSYLLELYLYFGKEKDASLARS